jgi:hypothetical protein
MTCNNLHKVSEYLQDRCSRIRYLRKYTTEDNLEFLDVLIEDMGIKNVEEVSKFCRENIKLLSMDNIVAFLNEVKMLEDEDITLDEIISVMNIDHIQPKGEIPEEESINNEEDDEYDDEDDVLDFDEPWDEECCCAA